jgi:hypothetical protein
MMMEVPHCSAVDDSISGPISHISPFGFIIFFSLLNRHFEGILYLWTNPNIKYIKLVKRVPLCPHMYTSTISLNIRMFIFAAFVFVFFHALTAWCVASADCNCAFQQAVAAQLDQMRGESLVSWYLSMSGAGQRIAAVARPIR